MYTDDINKTNYISPDYDDEKRWASYWHQIKDILDFNPKNVLIIGNGNGLVAEYFKLAGIKVVILDTDKTLNPDIVASVSKMPLKESEFDAVLCAEVLEHLPFENFIGALSEIQRVSMKGAVISLPHFGPAIKFLLKLPLLSEIKFMTKIPYPINHKFKREHYWEIGKKSYYLNRIKKEIIKSGLILEKDYIVFENPQHHFFVLKKSL